MAEITGLKYKTQIALPNGAEFRALLAVHGEYLLCATEDGIARLRVFDNMASVEATSPMFANALFAVVKPDQIIVVTPDAAFAGTTALTGFEKVAKPPTPADPPRPGGVSNSTNNFWYFHTHMNTISVFEATYGELPPLPQPRPINTTGIWTGWKRVEGSESPCRQGQREFEERQDFIITTLGQYGGEPPPDSPRFRRQVESC